MAFNVAFLFGKSVCEWKLESFFIATKVRQAMGKRPHLRVPQGVEFDVLRQFHCPSINKEPVCTRPPNPYIVMCSLGNRIIEGNMEEGSVFHLF